MTNSGTVWYLPGQGDKPSGPFSADQVLQSWQAGQLPKTTLCWREGMPQWLPLAQVQPFASRLGSAPPTAATSPDLASKQRHPVRRAIVWLLGLACLIAAGLAGYFYCSEWLSVRRAKNLIANGDYRESQSLLRPLAEGYFFRREAGYLAAVAAVKDYGSQAEAARDDRPLQKAARQLGPMLEQDESLRERVNSDLSGTLDEVPSAAPDLLTRSLAVARFLGDLKLVENKQLARTLLDKAKGAAEARGGQKPDVTFAGQILGWDPSLARKLVALVLPKSEAPPPVLSRELALIVGWAKQQPSLAKPLASGLLQCADQYVAEGKHGHTEPLFSAALQIDPDIHDAVCRQQLKAVERRLATGDIPGAEELLSRIDPQSPETKAEAANLHLQVASRLAEADPKAAQSALTRAEKVDSEAGDPENKGYLSIKVTPQPDEKKLRRCLEFLEKFPKSTHAAEVLTVLVTDLPAVLGQRGSWDAEDLQPYLEKADELLRKHPETPNLDAKLFQVAQSLAKSRHWDQAIDLGKKLLNAPKVDRKVKEDLPGLIVTWEQESNKRQVDTELKIYDLVHPKGVYVLERNPRDYHVVRVAPSCKRDGFGSEEQDILTGWVHNGGILWATNDVLEFFDIKKESGVSWETATEVCKPTSAVLYPPLSGCQQVQINSPPWLATKLSSDRHQVYLYLVTRGGAPRWSVVRYYEGYVSDVKEVDTSRYDGARFSNNFRRACLGEIEFVRERAHKAIEKTDPTRRVVPRPGPEGVTVVKTVGQLDQALAKLDKQRVMWVQLDTQQVGPERLKKLQQWVDQGGVLWLDTDLAREFQFLPLIAPSAGIAQKEAFVPILNHGVLKGLKPLAEVGFVPAPVPHVVVGVSADLVRKGTFPLLGWPLDPRRRFDPRVRSYVVCATRNRGRGLVVFRPREILTNSAEGKQFAENLLSWSLEGARPAKPDVQKKGE